MRPGNSQFNFRRYSYVNVSCEYTDRFRQSHHRVIEFLSFHFSFTKKDDEREGWEKNRSESVRLHLGNSHQSYLLF